MLNTWKLLSYLVLPKPYELDGIVTPFHREGIGSEELNYLSRLHS